MSPRQVFILIILGICCNISQEFALKRKPVETVTTPAPQPFDIYDQLCSYYRQRCDCARIRQFCVDPSCCNQSPFAVIRMIGQMMAIEDDDD